MSARPVTYAEVTTHGYGAYTNGCRCRTCRDAKNAYTRAKRKAAAEARAEAGPGYVAPVKTHGYSAYVNHGCRCSVCIWAHRDKQRAEWPARKARLAARETS